MADLRAIRFHLLIDNRYSYNSPKSIDHNSVGHEGQTNSPGNLQVELPCICFHPKANKQFQSDLHPDTSDRASFEVWGHDLHSCRYRMIQFHCTARKEAGIEPRGAEQWLKHRHASCSPSCHLSYISFLPSPFLSFPTIRSLACYVLYRLVASVHSFPRRAGSLSFHSFSSFSIQAKS